ncbi:hypothetical protein SSX86_012235 [Deinandra increscens subsp. villosa]|uniref:Uncharacterized protein n=1 Tax=Deinandra increscens subsp. villosa TaxID=3103831 RepID=A0AAP0DBD9_9ASTR
MSVIDVQIWTNSVFDDGGDSESFNSYNQLKSPSWVTKKPLTVNLSSDSLDSSFSSKENQSPNPVPLFSNHPIKTGSLKPNVVENLEVTDEEIEIENEIRRLFAKLESIRREKAEKNDKKNKNTEYVEKQGKLDLDKKSGVKKIQRRGFSLGPNEIMSAASSKSKQLEQFGTNPVQNRRKSCFWKLDDIEEEKSRVKNPSVRRAVTSIGSKKGVKKDDLILGSIQPKKLFGEQAKKPAVKPGRVIPSRYNQATVNSSMKKRESVRGGGAMESRVKKKWDLPISIPNRLNFEGESSVDNNHVDVVMPEPEVILPKIRVVRYEEEAGRDSGPAKRVAELVGRKSYFVDVCQKLSLDED